LFILELILTVWQDMFALVLFNNADEYGYDINNLTSEQIKMVLARYNGTNDDALNYGVSVREYYYSFKKYANSSEGCE